MEGSTRAIVKQVMRLGYAVEVRRAGGAVEMIAHCTGRAESVHYARCNDGDGPEEEYRAACLLAHAVGIRLEDG